MWFRLGLVTSPRDRRTSAPSVNTVDGVFELDTPNLLCDAGEDAQTRRIAFGIDLHQGAARHRLCAGTQRAAIDHLLAELAECDIYELQERYFTLFDRSRTLSLHLFEHVRGESRDRGQAMADLIELYRNHGLEPTAGELPDFLPLFLEFVSLLPGNEARALLAEPAGILLVLAERLATRESTYEAVFRALATLANAPAIDGPDTNVEDPDDLAALDAAWEEAAVHFGPGEKIGSCGTDRLRTRLRAAARDATAV